jgi:carnitine O-acetyltransferase
MPKSLGETLASTSPTSLPKPTTPLTNGHASDLRLPPKMPMTTAIPEHPRGGLTFAAQDDLPKLPIPDLESSCRRYLAALKPLQGPREHIETRMAVEDFLKSDGPDLQEKLQNYALGKSSFIEQFCKQISCIMNSTMLISYRVRFVSEFRQPCCSQPKPVFPARG